MKELLVTDLDHTFLNSSQKVSDFSRTIWNQVSTQHLITTATARSFKKVSEFLHGMELNTPLILLNGAMIVSSEKKIMDLKRLDKELVNDIIEEGRRFDIEPFVIALKDYNTIAESFYVPMKQNMHQTHLLTKYYANDPRRIELFKMEAQKDTLELVYLGDENHMRELYTLIKEKFDEVVEIKLAPDAYLGCWFLNVLHYKADKGTALEILSQEVGISLEKTTVFGDNMNDMGMFKVAKNSIAVSNALDVLKDRASLVLPHSNDEDGVARYLEERYL